jgi:hypothetical protein
LACKFATRKFRAAPPPVRALFLETAFNLKAYIRISSYEVYGADKFCRGV